MPVYLSLIPNLTEKDIKRFWEKISIENKKFCWNWKASTTIHGYGQFNIKRKFYKSHRIVYLLSNPTWKQDTYICHKCDNPSCCNPYHLFSGTAKDNIIDRDNKRRGKLPNQQGSNHSQSKLTEANIVDIRKQYAQGVKQSIIAKQYNIGAYQVSRIVNHKRWSHI